MKFSTVAIISVLSLLSGASAMATGGYGYKWDCPKTNGGYQLMGKDDSKGWFECKYSGMPGPGSCTYDMTSGDCDMTKSYSSCDTKADDCSKK